MFISLKRIIKSGWTNIFRNGGLSIAAVFIIVMALTLITCLFFLNDISKFIISLVEDKVDISVYFYSNAREEDIFKIMEDIDSIPEVEKVEYVSRSEALNRFIERNKDNAILMASLAEVGNPFLASLNIKAQDPQQYEKITLFLEQGEAKELIEKVDFFQRRQIIERIFYVKSQIQRIGLILGIILILVSVMVVFNTIRLAIYGSKEEIRTMRLVGASNWFIQGSFLSQGMIIGVFAALVSLLVITISAYLLSPSIESFIPELNVFKYFLSNFGIVALLQLIGGIGLGTISGLIAIRKYLNC